MTAGSLKGILDIDYEPDRTIVLIPSISFSGLTQKYLLGSNFFEERNLFFLACLVNPGTRFVAILSDTVDESFVAYCVRHVCSAYRLSKASVLARFEVIRVPVKDGEHLTQALLSKPKLLSNLREKLSHYPNPIIDFWLVSQIDIELAAELKLPYYGTPADALHFDNKSNARKLFSEIGIAVPLGAENIKTAREAWSGLQRFQEKSGADSYLIKLNSEEGGNGIALVSREAVSRTYEDFLAEIVTSKNIPLVEFLEALRVQGAVIEEYVTAPLKASPSVKMEILPDGGIRNLATHDQLLEGMTYAGSRFPADAGYRHELIRLGQLIAAAARDRGARGIISADFLATRESEAQPWKLWGLEINARKSATTHSNFWSRWLTRASYSEETGDLTVGGAPVMYQASEYFNCSGLGRVSPKEVLDAISAAKLDFDPERRSGVFVHMLSCIGRYSKVGATVIGRDNEEISVQWDAFKELLAKLSLEHQNTAPIEEDVDAQ